MEYGKEIHTAKSKRLPEIKIRHYKFPLYYIDLGLSELVATINYRDSSTYLYYLNNNASKSITPAVVCVQISLYVAFTCMGI